MALRGFGAFTYEQLNAAHVELFGVDLPPEQLADYQARYPDIATVRARWIAAYPNLIRQQIVVTTVPPIIPPIIPPTEEEGIPPWLLWGGIAVAAYFLLS